MELLFLNTANWISSFLDEIWGKGRLSTHKVTHVRAKINGRP